MSFKKGDKVKLSVRLDSDLPVGLEGIVETPTLMPYDKTEQMYRVRFSHLDEGEFIALFESEIVAA